MKFLLSILLFCLTISVMAQYEKNIAKIAVAPQEHYASNVLLRMTEGAGFRYYWATEGMNSKDFSFSACESCRSMSETVEHLFNLSEMVRSTVMGEIFEREKVKKFNKSEDIIEATNLNWVKAANYLLEERLDLSEVTIKFSEESEMPFWNLLNGPLADAIYHTGQVVSFRRINGNPINPKVNVFMGSLND